MKWFIFHTFPRHSIQCQRASRQSIENTPATPALVFVRRWCAGSETRELPFPSQRLVPIFPGRLLCHDVGTRRKCSAIQNAILAFLATSSSSTALLLSCVSGSTEIDCVRGGNTIVGRIEEGYEGDVEIITNIGPNDRLVLEPHMTSNVLTILELVYTDGDSTATVRTIRPLDADEIKMYSEALSYFVSCVRGPKNARQVYVLDVNDNAPIFQSKTYSATLSEMTAVGSDVLRVTATDADVSTENKRITYSILPPVPNDFEVRYDGNIRLTKPLNYNNVQQYIFTVEAKDIGGLSDTATVTIAVEDFDNLNPYFGHCLYKASIEENQVGHFSDVTPEAIKAQDGDTGINKPVVYSITTVLPNEYQNSFEIDQNSGVVSVTTALDRQEIEQIAVFIQATQQDDASKTANAVVLVTIEDGNDNPVKFDQGVRSSHPT